MESLRHHRSHGPNRFLGLLTHPEAPAPTSVGIELHEDEVLWTGPVSPEPNPTHSPKSPMASPSTAAFRRAPERAAGILAALMEDDKRLGGSAALFLQRRPVVSPPSASALALISQGSPSSSARMIPAIPKVAKPEGPRSMPAGKLFRQSSPVSVPVLAPRTPRHAEAEMNGGEEDEDEEEMLPPHEIVARSPLTTFSVLEGAGRTLKGRDLRRVRNAVWRKTGFLD